MKRPAPDPFVDETRAQQVADLMADFDCLLSGEAPRGAVKTAWTSDLTDSFRDMCGFLVLMERAWPRADTPAPAGSSATVPGAGGAWLALDLSKPGERPQLGRFRLLEELGRGGCGIVFLAEDPNTGRRVALKVPRPEALLTPELKRRFVREARAAASLNHPSIVGVHEAGEIGPVCFIASAYSPGTNLAAWLAAQGQAVEPRVAATIVALLADGVQHAHSRGVLHRDIKPSNVLLETLDDGQTAGDAPLVPLPFMPKLCDFGLAKLGGRDSHESFATRSGEMLGTPAYMAPEQVEGRPQAVMAAADVYSLGALLYELITGRVPHVGASHVEVLRRIVEDTPANPRRLRPAVDRDLAAITLKCLEKRPSHRYSSAAALGSDLRSYLGGLPIVARNTPVPIKLWRWSRRRPALAVSSAGLILVLAAGFAGVTWQWRRAEANLAIAKSERQRAEEHWLEENRLVSELFRTGELDTPDTRALLRGKARTRLGDRYRAIIAGAGTGFYSKAELATACTKYALLLGEDDALEPERFKLLDQGLGTWRQLAAERPADVRVQLGLVDAQLDAVYVCSTPSRFDTAAENARQAEQTLAALSDRGVQLEEHRYRLGIALRKLAGALYQATGDGARQAAIQAYQSAADYWRAMVAADYRNADYVHELSLCINRVGDGEASLSNWPAAIEAKREKLSLDLARIETMPTSPSTYLTAAKTHHSLARLYEKVDDLAGARTAYQDAAHLLEKLLTLDERRMSNDSRADTSLMLGYVYDSLSNTPSAAKHFAAAAEAYSLLTQEYPELGEYRSKLADSLFWSARMLGELNRPEANATFERACRQAASLATAPDAVRSSRFQLQRCYFIYGRHLAGHGEPAAAAGYYAKAAELTREFLAAYPDSKVWRDTLAECEQGMTPADAIGQ